MRGIVEGVMAVMDLVAGVMVAFAVLLTGNVPRPAVTDDSQHHPRTIRQRKERIAA